MTPGEFYREVVRRRLQGRTFHPWLRVVRDGVVLYRPLSRYLTMVNPGPVTVPCDPAVRGEWLADEPTVEQAAWARARLAELEENGQ